MGAERRLAQRLADAISAGEYRPGEWLKQIDLAAQFGATRFEVRRALEELALRNAVSHIPQKGYRVTVPTETDLDHSRAVRVIIETAAAREVARRIDEAGLAELEELAERFRAATLSGTPAERSLANHQFHDTMYAHAGNPLLSDLIREVRDRFRGTPIFLWPSMQSMQNSADDHSRILAALRARDEDAVAEAVRHHIDKSRK
jgi:DNA-binding GntR family transcriptional regulator